MKNKFLMLLGLAAIVMAVASCSKEEPTPFSLGSSFSNTAKYAPHEEEDVQRASEAIKEKGGSEVTNTIVVKVQGEDGKPLSDAVVLFNGKEVSTDDKGEVVIENVTIQEQFGYIRVRKAGYVDGSRAFKAIDAEHGATVTAVVRMLRLGEEVNVPSEGFSSVQISTPYGEGRIDFEGGFLEEGGRPYSGNVRVSTQYIDPLDPNTELTMPGDLRGLTTQNDIVPLISFGMVNVELIGDAGQLLQISSPATIRVPINPNQLATADPTIPMWYFNDAAGIWIEEGQSLRDGDDYVAVVNHFTWWNWDKPANQSCDLYGRVLDACGNEVIGAWCTMNGFWLGNYLGGWEWANVQPNTTYTLDATITLASGTYTGTATITTGGVGSANYVTITMNNLAQNMFSGRILDCLGNPIMTPTTILVTTPSGGTFTAGPFTGLYSIPYAGPPGTITFVATSGRITSLPIAIDACTPPRHDITICPERIEYSINGGPLHIDFLRSWGGQTTPTDFFVEAFDWSNPVAKTRIESHTTTVGTGYPYGIAFGDMEFASISDPAGMIAAGNGITFDLVSYPPVVGGMIEIEFSGPYVDGFGNNKRITGKAFVIRRF